MRKYDTARLFIRLTHAVMALLILSGVFIYRSMNVMEVDELMRVYHSYPYMMEHILCGLAAYLVFAVASAKIHRSGLHDPSQSGQN
jgi:hypothetical protein